MKELMEKRANLVHQAREIVDLAENEKRGLTSEEENRYNALMAEVTQLGDDIKRRKELEKLEQELGESAGVQTRAAQGAQGEEKRDGRASKEYREAYARYLSDGASGLRDVDVRALQANTGTLGGYLLAPAQMTEGLIKGLDDAVFVRQWATVIQVQGAADGLGAASLDSDPADADWTSELGTGNEDSSMSFGKRELHPHPLAKRIKISRKLLQKIPSVETLVRERLGYKFAVTMEKAYLTGSGAAQALGVFTASNDGIATTRDVSTGNTQTAMTFDGLIEAKYALKAGYWRNAKWIFHRDAVKMLAKIKDGEGRYVWSEAPRAGEPDRLLNLPLFMSEYAPNTFTAGLYAGILGDFSYYWIADDLGFEIQRLVELYAATNQVGFIGRLESDGMPVLGEAFVRVKLA